jgi:hypothetical protein
MLRMQEMTFPGFKFKKFSGRVLPQTPSIHAWYIGHTRGLQPLLSPSNNYLTERSLFKKCPPPGKSLKKALLQLPVPHVKDVVDECG